MNSNCNYLPAGFKSLDSLTAMVKEPLCRHGSKLLDDWFDEADDFLFVNATGHVEGFSEGLDAMRILRTQRQSLSNNFVSGLQQNLNGRALLVFAQGQQSTGPNVDCFETALALQSMQHRTEKFYARKYRLNWPFGKSEQTEAVNKKLLSFLLHCFIQAFSSSQKSLPLSITTRLVLFKLFEQQFLMKLSPVLSEVREILGAVLPHSGDSQEETVSRKDASSKKTVITRSSSVLLAGGNQDSGNAGAPGDGFKLEPAEATVSPAGEKFLNTDDITAISDMLDSAPSDTDSVMQDRQLARFLPTIDSLNTGDLVEYRINGRYQRLSFIKHESRPGLFTLSGQDSKLSITRSRLGLALSLQGGDLRILGEREYSENSKRTVITPPDSVLPH